jgi:nucleoside-diphosphate-sugar epimerase
VDVLGRDQDFSHGKAEALRGWRPRVGYAQGLAATLEWLREA